MLESIRTPIRFVLPRRSDAQVAGWKLVTDAVHKAGGRMLLQLWHVGRISDPMFLNGELPVAPSAIAPAGNVSIVRPPKPFVTPRALEIFDHIGIAQDAIDRGVWLQGGIL